MINFLAPHEFKVDRLGEYIGQAAVVDVVVHGAKVVYWATLSEKNWACRQVDVKIARQRLVPGVSGAQKHVFVP